MITGEGRLDATSWVGKVVGGVATLVEALEAEGLRKDVVVLAGEVSEESRLFGGPAGSITETIDLSAMFGPGLSRADSQGCAALATGNCLRGQSARIAFSFALEGSVTGKPDALATRSTSVA